MSYSWQPSTGDVVTVHFAGSPSIFDGIVRHYPQQAGEYWVIETDNETHYVGNYESIIRAKHHVAASPRPNEEKP